MADAGFPWGDLLTPAIAAAAVIVTKLIDRNQSKTTARDLIMKDFAIVKELPDGAAKTALLADLERRAEALTGDGSKRRDPVGIALGIVFILIGIGLALGGWHTGNTGLRTALWTMAVVVGALGVFGFVQDVIPAERDSKGRPIK